MLISVKQYADLVGRSPVSIRQRIERGTLPAVKIGRNWCIDDQTPFTDMRTKADREKNDE